PPCPTSFPYTTLFRSRFELGRSGELRQHSGRICLGTARRVTAQPSAVGRQHRAQGVDDVAAVPAIGGERCEHGLQQISRLWSVADRESTRLKSSHQIN